MVKNIVLKAMVGILALLAISAVFADSPFPPPPPWDPTLNECSQCYAGCRWYDIGCQITCWSIFQRCRELYG